jgi:hypothetical protein
MSIGYALCDLPETVEHAPGQAARDAPVCQSALAVPRILGKLALLEMENQMNRMFAAGAATALALCAAALGAFRDIRPAKAAADKALGPAIMGAHIAGEGGITRGFGVVSSSRPDQGRFEVVFERDVTQCIYTATLSLTVNYVIVADSLPGVPNGVLVRTYRATDSALSNIPFYLSVTCGR